ncbi:MAG: SDR family NAD(P)-dependent oxidoreductase [Pseudomonadota bacterium]
MNQTSNQHPRLLEGKVALITGSGRGIGREIALQMAAQGARVVVNDVGTSVSGEGNDNGPAAEVVREIRALGGEAIANTDSVSEWPEAERMIASAVDSFGRIDIVVNNAGILRDRMFHNMDFAEWDSVIKVHLYGTFNVSRAAAPHFRKQQSGAYVHMTSSSGLIGQLGQSNYAAAKLGIVGLSKSIALDMARYNIRSNCISPAAFSRMTETVPGLTPEQQALQEMKQKKTRPDQIAPLAVFLASDAASAVNGQIIGLRGTEIYLYSQHRPVRTLHRSEGWSVQSLQDQMVPAWKPSFVPLERNRDVFGWDPL